MSSRAMNVISVVIELIMRLLVAVCVSNFVVHGFLASEVFKAFETLYILVPVTGYFFARRYLYARPKLMLLVHFLCAGSVLVAVKGSAEEIFVTVLVAVFFLVLSLASQNSGSFLPLDMGLILACFVLGRTTKVATAAVLPVYSAMLYVICFFIHLNLKNVRSFLQENAQIKSFRAEQAQNVNTVMMTFFMIACLLAMFIAPRLHIQNIIRYVGVWLWNGILYFLQKLDFPVGGYELEFGNPKEEQLSGEGEMALPFDMGEGSVLLDTAALVIGSVLLVGLIVLAVLAIRRIRFEKLDGTDKKEFILPDFRDFRAERVQEQRGEAPVFGNNSEKVRKKYKRLVLKYKGKNTVIPRTAAPEGITRLAGGSGDITALYEKARYGNLSVTDEEVKQMDWRRENEQ